VERVQHPYSVRLRRTLRGRPGQCRPDPPSRGPEGHSQGRHPATGHSKPLRGGSPGRGGGTGGAALQRAAPRPLQRPDLRVGRFDRRRVPGQRAGADAGTPGYREARRPQGPAGGRRPDHFQLTHIRAHTERHTHEVNLRRCLGADQASVHPHRQERDHLRDHAHRRCLRLGRNRPQLRAGGSVLPEQRPAGRPAPAPREEHHRCHRRAHPRRRWHAHRGGCHLRADPGGQEREHRQHLQVADRHRGRRDRGAAVAAGARHRPRNGEQRLPHLRLRVTCNPGRLSAGRGAPT